MHKTNSSADIDVDSTKSNGEEKEKSLQDKALDGTIASSDFMGFIVDYIRRQNTENLKTSECSLSKSQLDWNLKGNPCPVVDFNDTTNYVTDTLKIFNNAKNRKVYFNIDLVQNPKFSVVFNPESGSIPKNGSVEIIFKMHAYCTTKVYQMFKIGLSLSKKRDNKSGTTRKTSLFGGKKKEDEIGQLFASFKVESELSASIDFDEIKMGDQLAKGGFGTVYKGEWRTTEVAVKVLNTQELIEEERENVRREIQLMKKLNYSYIVTYMGASQVQGQKIAIVMEYVRGGSLTDLLKKELSDHFKCKLCQDIAKGMAFLHSHNIYHRDIKPDNMLVFSPHPDSHVNLKITDFGTSRASTMSSNRMMDPAYQAFNDLSQLKPEQQKQTRRMTKGIGTLIYQAPEIIRGESDYSIDKTDIYSFGVLLLEVFTQKEPYSEAPYEKWTKWELEKFVSSGKRIEIPSNLPARIRELIAKCWDQTPVKRPDFASIVKTITDIMESFPADNAPAPISRVQSTPSVRNLTQPTSPVPAAKSGVPVPNGNLSSIGWVAEWERKECEAKLKGMPVGTFMLRWSQNTTSYVLTYQNKTGPPQHIAYIIPNAQGQIYVDKEDGKKAFYESIFDYINAMKESGIITKPFIIPTKASEDVYGKTPTLQ